MGFASTNDFVAVLKTHTTHVRTYERLFSDVEETSQQKVDAPTIVIDKDAALATAAARVLAQHISTDRAGTELVSGQHVSTERGSAGLTSLTYRLVFRPPITQPHRALVQLARITASLREDRSANKDLRRKSTSPGPNLRLV